MFTPNQSLNNKVSPGRRGDPRMPIWAPNLGVPPAARVLAYIFGILMLFTVVFSKVYLRPADIPAIPKQSEWRTYSTPDFSISYPDGWTIDEVPIKMSEQKFIRFFPIPDEYIRVGSFIFSGNRALGDRDIENITEIVEGLLSKEYSGYSAGEVIASMDSADNWHLFDGKMIGEEKRPITGAWVLKVQGSKVLFLEAISAKAGWDNMSQLFSTMSESVVLAEESDPSYGSYYNE